MIWACTCTCTVNVHRMQYIMSQTESIGVFTKIFTYMLCECITYRLPFPEGPDSLTDSFMGITLMNVHCRYTCCSINNVCFLSFSTASTRSSWAISYVNYHLLICAGIMIVQVFFMKLQLSCIKLQSFLFSIDFVFHKSCLYVWGKT